MLNNVTMQFGLNDPKISFMFLMQNVISYFSLDFGVKYDTSFDRRRFSKAALFSVGLWVKHLWFDSRIISLSSLHPRDQRT